MHITGFLIRTDGSAEAVDVVEGSTGHLAHMRSLIGAECVDVISAKGAYGTVDTWVDDEGAFTAIPNVAATVIVSELAGNTIPPIFGAALLLSRDGADTTGLSADQVECVKELHVLALKMPKLHDSIRRANAEATLSGRR